MIIYIDGLEAQTGSPPKPSVLSRDVLIGRRGYTTCSSFYNGLIDDVRIYDRALSNEEIWQLYQNFGRYKYQLDYNSPCVNSGDPCTDSNEVGLLDIDNESRIMCGRVIDIGADELYSAEVYGTSFEDCQGFPNYSSVDNKDGWEVSGESGHGHAIIRKDYIDGNYYQYLSISYLHNSSAAKNISGGGIASQMQYIRFGCIPIQNCDVNIVNEANAVASVYFADNNNIYVLHGGAYVDTGVDYGNAASLARYFLKENPPVSDANYTYQNTWIEFEIVFDWESCTYDVFWSYWDGTQYNVREVIKEDANFDQCYSGFTDIEFNNQISGGDNFEINRMAVSNNSNTEGVIGEDEDVYIYLPDADPERPIKGRCKIIGSMWHYGLGCYEIKSCAADLDINDANNWEDVTQGGHIFEYGVMGYWDTSMLKNGDYFLRIDLYNDFDESPHNQKIMSRTLTCNRGEYQKEVNIRYPVFTKLEGGEFYYEDKPDIAVDWPGQFPFELKRTYNSKRAKYLFPMGPGWTYSHDIKLYEDCTFNWATDGGVPVADAQGLGIGKIWLMNCGSSTLFTGDVDPYDSNQVIYESTLENEYIIRTSSTDFNAAPKFSVSYTYYGRDGIDIEFDRVEEGSPVEYELNYVPYPDEGAVDWSVFVGATEKRDRFENALNYTWGYYEDEFPVYVSEITNNCTSAYIEFEMNEVYPLLYYKAYLKVEGSDANVMTVSYDVTIDWNVYTCEVTRSADRVLIQPEDPENPEPEELIYEERMEYTHSIVFGDTTYLLRGNPDGCIECEDPTFIVRYYTEDKRVVLKMREKAQQDKCKWIRNRADYILQDCDYEYDDANNLVTVHSYADQGCETGGTAPDHKIITTVQNSNGAVLSEKTETISFTDRDLKFCDYDVFYEYYCRLGGGGVTDVNRFYEDERFPIKPTEVIEYFDDDGDGYYDQDSRRTEMKYDEFGNLIERRVYIDDVNFAATEWEYHPLYDFQTRQTTWQGYCYDDGQGNIVPSGGKVESINVYGDANGTIDSEDNLLVQKKTLLDDLGTTDPCDDEWAVTYYKYYETGLVRSETDPAGNITFYEYDVNGFKTKVWKGATLDAGGNPIGDPQERYYHNEVGQCLLQADALGAVTMDIYDGLGRIEETRKYSDEDAMSRTVFHPGVYYNPDVNDFDSRKQYWYYGTVDARNDHPPEGDGSVPSRLLRGAPYVKEILDTGGVVRRRHEYGFHAAEPTVFAYPDGSVVYQLVMPDGEPIHKEHIPNYEEGDEGFIGGFRQDFHYDSMNRPIHKIWREHERVVGEAKDFRPLAVKHEETGYYGDGNKQFEKTYKVTCWKDVNDNWQYVETPEKHVEYEYDALGRLINQIDHNDVNSLLSYPKVTSFGYDAAGNKIYVIDPAGNVIFTDYDNANRKIKTFFATEPVVNGAIIDFDATKANACLKRKIEYFDDGKIESVVSYDYDGITILSEKQFTYDERGRVEMVTESIDESTTATTTYSYRDQSSADGLLGPDGDKNYHIEIEDAEGQCTWIKLNEYGKVKKVLYPSGLYELTEYTHESAGKKYILPYRKSVWDANGVQHWVQYEYDEYGKVKSVIYPDTEPDVDNDLDGSLTDANDVRLEYEYDEPIFGRYGRVKLITDYRNSEHRIGDAGDEFEYTYDGFNRIVSYKDGSEYMVEYDYRMADGQKELIKVVETADPNQAIYTVGYEHDLFGRLQRVYDPCILDVNISSLQYDDNGNRSQLKYWLNGQLSGPSVTIDYDYSLDNRLIDITTSATGGGVNYTFDASASGDIDGLGRLGNAAETISYPGQSNRTHYLEYTYDMLSQLTYANISNIGGVPWIYDYYYKKDGNIYKKTVNNSNDTLYEYDTTSGGDVFDSDIMTKADGNSLVWNENGQLAETPTISFEYNWDGRLSSAVFDGNSIDIKYDPRGNRVCKYSTIKGDRYYIVDIAGKLPTILCEIDPSDSSLKNSYVYANGQILCQCEGETDPNRYFYIHDRLGSVRLVVNDAADVNNSYTYSPFGEMFATECTETTENPFKFAGQWFDSEIVQYYLRARQYYPYLGRFTSRDPVKGKFKEPLTLHAYLYCGNNPTNYIDPDGRIAIVIGGSFSGNITAFDLSFGFNDRRGLGGIGAMAAYYSVILPAMTMLSDHFGVGGTAGAGFVAAWDHTRGLKGLNDRDAWSWGTMRWAAAGASVASGLGGCFTLDVGVSNATHVSQLAGRFVEGGGSGFIPSLGIVVGGTLAWGVNPDGSWNDIWLGTVSGGAGTPGYEGHLFVGNAWVHEYDF
jgi:RHS repeat-associated protein